MDVAAWLRGLGLEEYAPRFAENHIGPDLLPSLTAEDLKELGIASIGHRRRLLDAIAALRAAPAPSVEPQPAAREREAERRQLTVMFCDLVGSTALSARLDPEDLRAVIGAYHRCCAEVIGRAGGYVAKYMGDGVLAYFGYPEADEDDAERAVRAGLALVEAVGALSLTPALSQGERERALESPLPLGEGEGEGAGGGKRKLQTRIGIATGLVVVGEVIGQGAAQEQAVVGETPNLAARLQALAAPDTVVIAPSTRRLLGGLFEYRELGEVALKGFAEPVPAFQVVRERSVESRFEARQERGISPLVGRAEELELLLRRWRQAQGGEGRVVLLTGEPGIGKSRIVSELLDRLAGEPHIRQRYSCSPHHQDSALHPIIAQIEHAAGLAREDSPDAKLQKLETLLARSSATEEEIALMAGLLSVPTGDRYQLPGMSPQRRKEKTLQALLAQSERLAATRLLLVVVEDLHWIDPTSLELLMLAIERWGDHPILLLLTARPEFTPPWPSHAHASVIALGRLARAEGRALVERITGGKPLPPEVLDQILTRTDGIPLFVEELTKTVLESGAVREEDGRYALNGPLPSLAIPTTLHDSLMSRLDRLAPVREVAQIGAALGREFSYELLRAVSGMPDQRLQSALGDLVRSELVFRRGHPSHAVYTFKHALVQDAAYQSMLKSRRVQLHARIALALENGFQEIVLAQPALLAKHCADAGLAEKAVAYRLKAGQQALARSAMTEAVAQFRKGLEALAAVSDGQWRREEELELLIVLGSALTATQGWSAADVSETFGRANELADRIHRPELLVPLIMGRYTHHLVRAEHKLALQLGAQLEEIGNARHDVWAQLMSYTSRGITQFLLGELAAARDLLERFCEVFDPEDRRIAALSFDPRAITLTWLALTLGYLGYVDQARSRMAEALSEARQLHHAHTLAHVLLFTNWLDWITGSPMAHVEEVFALTTEHAFPHYFGWALAYRGKSLIDLGQAQEGAALLRQGLAELRATEGLVSMPMLLTWLAEGHAALGQSAEEQSYLSEASQLVDKTEERVSEAELLYRVPGDLLNSRGHRAAAERHYLQAVDIAERQGARLLQLRATTSVARLWRDEGKIADAHALLAPAYRGFTEGFQVPVLMQAKMLLDELQSLDDRNNSSLSSIAW